MGKYRELPIHVGSLSNKNGHDQMGTFEGSDTLVHSHGGRHGVFRAEHVRNTGGYISGAKKFTDDEGKPIIFNYSEWPSFARSYGGTPWPPVALDTPSKAWLSTQLIAATNPSKPSFDALRAIGELKDLPEMLRGIGDSFLTKGTAYAFGHLNLTYKFGWAPFCQDVVSLFTCQALVKTRFDMLNNLRKNGSVIRKRTLFDQKNTTYGSFHNDYWKMSLSTEAHDKVWGYTIWKPTDTFPTTDDALFQLARHCALGLTIRPKVLWDLLPWSWAIDWFANVGDFLQATDNTADLSMTVANLCYMREVYRRATDPVRTDPQPEDDSLTISPMEFYSKEANRFGADPPTLTAQWPALTGEQLGILGSITATRR